MVVMPLRNKTICTMKRAKLSALIAYVSSLVVCIPGYLTFSVTTAFSKKPSVTTPPPSLMMTTLSASRELLSSDTFNEPSILLGASVNDEITRSGYPVYIVHYSTLGEAHGRLLVQANFWIYRWEVFSIPIDNSKRI